VGLLVSPQTGKAIVEIVILAVIFYVVLAFLRGTRGSGVLRGLSIFMAVAFIGLGVIIEVFRLGTLEVLYNYMMAVSLVAIIVLFQPELRRGFSRLGQNPFFSVFTKSRGGVVGEVVQAAGTLSKKRIGGIIAFQRKVALASIADAAIRLDADISAELLVTIFWPGSPLHDGAAVIQNGKVIAAGCVLPLSDSELLGRGLGMRHRAAVGVTEDTDAICVIVSEETGSISLAEKGALTQGLDEDSLRKALWEATTTAEIVA